METQPTSAFSSSDSDVIHQASAVEPELFDDTEKNISLEEAYEVQRTTEEIVARDYRIIALQFPDELLHDSVQVHRLLKMKLATSRELYILADSTFGSCCPDEIAAQHVNADVLVHYGHACLSPSARLPVIYVFGKRAIDLEHCTRSLVEVSQSGLEAQPESTVDVRFDVSYAYSSDKLCHTIRSLLGPKRRIVSSSLGRFQTAAPLMSLPNQGATESANDKSSPSIIFYIGAESLHLTNLIMTHSECEVYTYDPVMRTAALASERTNKLLMRRYGLVHRARDADVFGILVGTLAVASYLPMMTHLRMLLARAKKKTYTISVGKLNPAKLANFMEIECFVLVACPENSLIESRDFFKPIITPFELEVALGPEGTWPSHYMLDFHEILDHAMASTEDEHAADARQESDEEKPSYSFSTGRYRTAKVFANGGHVSASDGAGALMIRNSATALTIGGAGQVEFFQNRSFQGLEQRLDQDSPSVLEEGRSGIARGYTDDHRP